MGGAFYLDGVDEVESEGLGDEVVGALLVVELAVALGDLLKEVIGGDWLAWLEDVVDDAAEGLVIDGGALGDGSDLVGEVVGADGETEEGIDGAATHVVAVDEADGGDVALGGEGEHVGGVEEEELAEVARGGGFLAEVVVADEEEGGRGMVGDVADNAAEVGGDCDAAEGHEVVDVVNDDEVGLEALDEGLGVTVDGIDVVALAAEDVEADEVKIAAGGGMGREFMVDAGADVGAVEGVYPENLAGTIGIAGGCGKELDGEVLGEVMGVAGLLASEVGDVVLTQDGLAVDGDQWVDSKGAEVGLAGELAVLPGLVGAGSGGNAIIVDFHGVFLV